MNLIYLSLPAVIILDIYIWTWIAGLLSAPSDLAVFGGIVCIFVILTLHYALYKLLKSKLKL